MKMHQFMSSDFVKTVLFYLFCIPSQIDRGVAKKIKFGSEIMGVEIFGKREYHTPFFNAHVCPKADILLIMLYRYI